MGRKLISAPAVIYISSPAIAINFGAEIDSPVPLAMRSQMQRGDLVLPLDRPQHSSLLRANEFAVTHLIQIQSHTVARRGVSLRLC